MIDVLSVLLDAFNRRTERSELHSQQVFFNSSADNGHAQLVRLHHVVDLLCQVVDVVIVVTVRQKPVQVLVAYECIFICRHSLSITSQNYNLGANPMFVLDGFFAKLHNYF